MDICRNGTISFIIISSLCMKNTIHETTNKKADEGGYQFIIGEEIRSQYCNNHSMLFAVQIHPETTFVVHFVHRDDSHTTARPLHLLLLRGLGCVAQCV